MEAFKHTHYVPVLFTKAAERQALSELDAAAKAALTPLFVIHPIDWVFETDAPQKTVDDHLKKLPDELVKCWGTTAAFIDASFVENESMQDGSHPVEWMVREAAFRKLDLVPVVSPAYSLDYSKAVKRLVEEADEPEICLRLEIEDWPLSSADASLDDFLRDMDIAPAQVHLVLDLRDQTSSTALFATTSALQQLSHVAEWKTLTVAGTAMPRDLPGGAGAHEIDRQEWSNYKSVVAQGSNFERLPTFADYAITHPDPFSGVDPRAMQISAKLKYTADQSWILVRGGLFKGHAGRSLGGVTIRPVALELSARNEFSVNHCGADEWIADAAGNGKTGSPLTWVKIGTWHHLLRVLDQIALMTSPAANQSGS